MASGTLLPSERLCALCLVLTVGKLCSLPILSFLICEMGEEGRRTKAPPPGLCGEESRKIPLQGFGQSLAHVSAQWFSAAVTFTVIIIFIFIDG